MLYCAFGMRGASRPFGPPPPELWAAEAAVQISSPRVVANTAVTDFAIGGASMTHPVSVSEVGGAFLQPDRDNLAYYMEPGPNLPWNGTLPDRKIQLRIRVALSGEPQMEVGGRAVIPSCRLTLGPYVIERHFDAMWP
jgi:hypothetical protein